MNDKDSDKVYKWLLLSCIIVVCIYAKNRFLVIWLNQEATLIYLGI